MAFNLESRKNNEIKENPEEKISSEKLAETEKKADNFDDCSLNEAKDSKGNEVNSESLKEAEENFDDCEAKLDEAEKNNPEETDDDTDDFNDCGKETEGKYVAEVTYVTDGEIDSEEAGAEIQEAYNKTDDPEDMAQLKENIDQNEHIEAVNAEVIERPEVPEETEEPAENTEETDYQEAQQEYEEAKEELEARQEAAEEYQQEVEEQPEKQEESVEIEPENPENTDDDFDDVGKDETAETEEEFDDASDADENADEDSDEEYEADPEGDERLETEGELGEDANESQDVTEVSEENQDAAEVEETAESKDAEGSDAQDEIPDKPSEEDETEELTADETDNSSSEENTEISDAQQEEIAEETKEAVEQQTDTELTDEEKERLEQELESKAEDNSEDGEISAEEVREASEEQIEEETSKVEEARENASEEIETAVKETAESDEEISEEDMKEKLEEEAYDSAADADLDSTQTEEIVSEKSEEIDEKTEEKQDRETEDEQRRLEEESDRRAEETEKPTDDLNKRIDSALERDDVDFSEVHELADENEELLKNAVNERDAVELSMEEKFSEVMSLQRGTDEYKQALEEYNALKDTKEDLDGKVAELTERRERLDQRSTELRQAQLEKGAEAAAAAAFTVASAKLLESRFDEEYYEDRPDKDELKNLSADNTEVVKELSDEQASIKRAMDAKMAEISDYVMSNNMERYDTYTDAHYKQMVQEYLSLKEAHDRVGYFAVKLDENNRLIAESLGEQYVSARETKKLSPVPEVNQGRDVPGVTDYFTDETRTKEVLAPFDGKTWENLTLDEQKRAVERLADYNADILGIEDKPYIVYYSHEDSSDFGGFSAEQNVIYINEYTMGDAAETADTVSHEYRHKYQHERAEKLECERDLEFKEGFEDYIRPEDDYQAYREQFVEADARAYADAVREKIDSYDSATVFEDADSSEDTAEASARLMSPDEEARHWQQSVVYVDTMIENYREALNDRGVPNGPWLDKKLAEHRARMLEQEGHNLDVASGHAADSEHTAEAYKYLDNPPGFYDALVEEYWRDSWEVEKQKTFITNRGERITYEEAVNRIVTTADRYMASKEIDYATRESVIADVRNVLIKQQITAEGRNLGDHGIRHIYGNFERGEGYLSTRPDLNDEQKLAVLIAHVYHDEGYIKPPNSTGALKGGDDRQHDEASLGLWNERHKLYDKVFSKETLESIDVAIGDHNIAAKDTEHRKKKIDGKKKIAENTSVSADPIVSTVHLCDKLALSQREKLSELIISNPEIAKLAENMKSMASLIKNEKFEYYKNGKLTSEGKELLEQYHGKINEYIDRQRYDKKYSDRLKEAVDKDLGFDAGKYSSRMNYIYTKSDCIQYNAVEKRNEIELTIIEYPGSKTDDLQTEQLGKLLEDLAVELPEDKTERSKLLKDVINSGEYSFDGGRGLYIRIDRKTAEEIRDIEAEQFEKNDDLIEMHKKIEQGRSKDAEIREAVRVIEQNKDDEDIQYAGYRYLARIARVENPCSKKEFKKLKPSEKAAELKKLIPRIVLQKADDMLKEG